MPAARAGAVSDTLRLLPLAEQVELFMETVKLGRRPNTIQHYQYALAAVVATAQGQPLTQDVIVRHMQSLFGKKRSREAVQFPWIALKRFCAWLTEQRGCDVNPMAGLPTPQFPAPRLSQRPLIARAEYERLKNAAAGRPMRFMVVLGWFTGMSIEDCARLQWCHVDLDECIIRKGRIKTGRLCTIPFMRDGELHREILRQRRIYPPMSDADWVCPPAGESPPGSYSSSFVYLCKQHGIKKSFHSFRVTMCSRLANSDMNVVNAQAITGHSNPAIFGRYVRPDSEVLRKHLARLTEHQQAMTAP